MPDRLEKDSHFRGLPQVDGLGAGSFESYIFGAVVLGHRHPDGFVLINKAIGGDLYTGVAIVLPAFQTVVGRKIIPALKFRVNDHPRSGWLEFSAIGRKGKSTSVL